MKFNVRRQIDQRRGQVTNWHRHLCQADPLTTDQEQDLARRIEAGDMAAADTLVLHNMRFVLSCATSLAASKVSIDDAMGAGCHGAIVAARRFRPGHGRFISYAVHWINRFIAGERLNMGDPVRVPHNYTQFAAKIQAANSIHKNETGLQLPYDRAVEIAGSEARADAGMVTIASHQSMEQPVGPDRNAEQWGSFLADQGPAPDELAERNSENAYLDRILATLTDRERDMVVSYFGIGREEPETLEVIGLRHGVSRERVRQIRDEAIFRIQVRAGVRDRDDLPRFMKLARKRDAKRSWKDRGKKTSKNSNNLRPNQQHPAKTVALEPRAPGEAEDG